MHRDARGHAAKHVVLDHGKLRFCTTEACWAFDPNDASIGPAPAPKEDFPASAVWVDGAQARFCRTERNCKQFELAYPYKIEGASGYQNAARTLGAVVATPANYEDPRAPRSTVFLFDLVKAKQVAKLEGQHVDLFEHAFAIDGYALYTADGKQLALLAVPDPSLVEAGDVVLVTDGARDQLIMQEFATGKVRSRIALGTPANAAFRYVVDGKTAYAIGGIADEGEVVVIDLAAAKIRARTSPPICR